MMRRPAYLDWAIRHYGRVDFDLATSGVPTVAQAELGAIASLDDPNGFEQLREAIARYHGLPVAEVTGALGTSHGVWLGYAALVERGDDVLVETPAYEPLVASAEANGANVIRFDRGADVGFALDPDRVRAAMTPRTRVVAVTTLHNPSGVRASDDALREIATMLQKTGGTLFVDEVYAPFDTLVDAQGVFRGSARKLAPNIVATGSLTKVYGLGPQRIGWVLGAPDVIERVHDAVIASMGVLPLPWMFRGVLGLSRMPALAERTRQLLSDKRERVAAWMRARPWIRWSAPEAGLFGFGIVEGAKDLRPFIERGIETHGVIVAPGSFFGIENGFRLAWSLPDEKLDEALTRVERVLEEARR